jgi:hypothetical protein
LAYKISFLPIIILFSSLLLTPLAYADVVSVEVYPENPVQGDVVKAVIKADPNEEIPVTISFTKTLLVVDGKYEWRINGVNIPQTPNSFTIKASNVKNLHVAVKILFWIGKSTEAKNGVATISQSNIPPGTYGAIIHGEAAESTSTVTVHVTASTKIKTNSEGLYEFTYDTNPIPPGTFTIKIGETTKTIVLREKTSQPSQPPSGGGGAVGGGTQPTLKPAEFKIKTLKLDKHEAKIGEPLTATIQIENIGEKQGTYTVKIYLNGELKETREIMLSGGLTKTINYTFTAEKPGIYTVQVNGQAVTLNVKPQIYLPLNQKPPKTSKEKIMVGETVSLTGEVYNNSTLKQETTYIIQIKNQHGRVVYLNYTYGEIQPKTFKQYILQWKPEKPGKYTIEAYIWKNWEKPRPLTHPTKTTITINYIPL